MASYEGDDFGAFLPGLTRIVKQPFKTAAKVTKTFFKSPIKGIGQAILAPLDMVKAVKYAAMGSKPIFRGKKRKRVPIVTASATPESRATSVPNYDNTQSTVAPQDSGVPTIDIPETQPQSSPKGPAEVPVSEYPMESSAPEAATQQPSGKSNMLIPLLLVAGVGAALFLGTRSKGPMGGTGQSISKE
jgi:hypothetical protein